MLSKEIPPRFGATVARVESRVQVIGLITWAPGSPTGSGSVAVGATVLWEMMTPVSPEPVANVSSSLCCRYCGVMEYLGTYAAIIRS